MSLLLDARKKSQQARSAQSGSEKLLAGHPDGDRPGLEPSLEDHPNPTSSKPDAHPVAASSDEKLLSGHPDDRARSAGKNLFSAKSPAASPVRTGGINRNILLALGSTVMLLAAGAGYLWYIDSASSDQPLRHRVPTAAAPVGPAHAPGAATPQNADTTTDRATDETTSHSTDETTTPASADSAQQAQLTSDKLHEINKASSQPAKHIRIKPQQTELLDPLINNAYRAYRSGKLDEARQMYLEVLGAEELLAGHPKDARNTDALLGLAAIAQQRGEDGFAAQYYARVLTLDPRNAVANAGMSALTTDESSESRLKNLLREQRDSAALHFALGNIYAGQSRWGEAQSAYFNAYTLGSKNAELAFNLAVSLDHLGQNKLAAQYYQRALQLDQTGGDQSHGFDHAQISQRVKELTR